MERRRLLRLAGTTAVAGLAGCLGALDADNGGTPTTPPTTFMSGGSRCGEQVDDATVSYADGVVTVEGTTWGNDGCDAARLGSVDLADATLTIRVTAERVEGKEACIQCITELDYRAEVAVEPRPDEVVVVHRGEVVRTVRP